LWDALLFGCPLKTIQIRLRDKKVPLSMMGKVEILFCFSYNSFNMEPLHVRGYRKEKEF
jgi:hypothetical protein